MSDKTIEEVLEFITAKIDESVIFLNPERRKAFELIRDYIESHRSELTPEELAQVKEKINNTPITRHEVDEDELNRE